MRHAAGEAALAAAFHRTAMVQSLGRKPEKQRQAAIDALKLAATDIAATCGFEHAAFMRACGFPS